MLIRLLESKQISTVADTGLRRRTQVRDRLPYSARQGSIFQLHHYLTKIEYY
jgi:hypothetical protein